MNFYIFNLLQNWKLTVWNGVRVRIRIRVRVIVIARVSVVNLFVFNCSYYQFNIEILYGS